MANRIGEDINDAKGSGDFVIITVDKDLLSPLTSESFVLWH
tara:strand:+ start:189 stop:311 length:123 start_codon:yes stop_codon:yes gene_type:complete